MPNLLRRPQSSVKENLVCSLEALNSTGEITYLIKDLKESTISNETEAFLAIFATLYCHPDLLDHPQNKALLALNKTCALRINSETLLEILNRPINRKMQDLFNNLAKFALDFYKEQSPLPRKP